MDFLESIAHDAGCTKMELTSGSHRKGAHKFYKNLGYTEKPKRFFKEFVLISILILGKGINPQKGNKGGIDGINWSILPHYLDLFISIFYSSRRGCKHG